MYEYLFLNPHNGFYNSYKPFKSDKKITQEMAYKAIEKVNPCVSRIGCNIDDLGQGLDYFYHITIQPYFSEYIKLEDDFSAISAMPSLDPLPRDFYDWFVIEGISGNY